MSAEQAERVAREAFAIPEDFQPAGASFSQYGPDQQGTWHLDWRKRVDRGFESISVSVNALTGEVLSMFQGSDGPPEDPGLVPVVSEEEARALARELIARLQPVESARVREEEGGLEPTYQPTVRGPVQYSFRFIRVENDIPVDNNWFGVTVDGASGRIRSYTFQWDKELELPPPDKILTPEAAGQVFREKVGVRPAYGRVNKPGGPGTRPEYKLVYGPAPGGSIPMIDAATGRVIDAFGEPVDEADLAAWPRLPEELPPDEPRGAGSGEIAPEKVLSREEALARVAGLVTIPAGFELEGAGFNEFVPPGRTRGTKTWSFNWRGPEGDDPRRPAAGIGAELDAVTGDLVSYNFWDRKEVMEGDKNEVEVRVGLDEATHLADAFIARVRPSMAGRLWRNPLASRTPLGKRVMPGMQYNFQYHLLAYGIPALDASCGVGVDPITGDVRGFYCSAREEADYPPSADPIGEARAAGIVLEKIGLRLRYVRLNSPPDPRPGPGPEEAAGYRLAYVLGNRQEGGNASRWVDAHTGEVLDWSLNSLSARDAEAITDIRGHWAEADIKAVVGRGILPPQGGLFHPDASLSRADALEALLAVARPAVWRMARMGMAAAEDSAAVERRITYHDVEPDSPHYAVVSEALQYGIIQLADEFRPDDPVTREEMAVMVARSLGYKALVEGDGRFFTLPFRDRGRIAPWARNAVALTGALGVFRPDAGRFNPKAPVTRAQMAVILVRLSAVVDR